MSGHGSRKGDLAGWKELAVQSRCRVPGWVERVVVMSSCQSRRDGLVGGGRAPKRSIHRQKSSRLAALWPYELLPFHSRLLMFVGSICDWPGRRSAEEPGSSPANITSYLGAYSGHARYPEAISRIQWSSQV